MTSTICAPPLKTLPIATCIGELTIGKISDHNASAIVHLLDITTGRKEVFQETSANDGTIIIDLSDNEFSDRHAYELWVTLATSQEKKTITVGTETGEVIALNFAACVEGGELFELPAVTLEAL